MVLRGLAVAIGLEESIVVQQMFWLLQDPRNGKDHKGHRWLYNTYEQWQEQFFPFWSTRTLRRVFDQLETMHLVESCQPEGAMSRRKWYRLNVGMIQNLTQERLLQKEAAKLATSKRPKRTLPLTEKTGAEKTLSQDTKESPKGDSESSGVKIQYKAVWIQDELPKEEQLKYIKPPPEIYTSRGFSNLVDRLKLRMIQKYRPDLYHRLCLDKWHVWEDTIKKWKPINNLEAFLRGMNSNMKEQVTWD